MIAPSYLVRPFLTAALLATSVAIRLDAQVRSLTNASYIAGCGPGEEAILGTFVIEGSAAKTVLIRGLGPKLSPPFLSVMADPVLQVLDATGAVVFTNDNWEEGSATNADFTAAGASTLTAGSKDAALLLTLAPGTYTARITGAGTTTGNAMLEIFDRTTTGRIPYFGVRQGRSSLGTSLGFLVATGTTPMVLIRGVGPAVVASGGSSSWVNPSINVFQGAANVATNADWANDPALSTTGLEAGLIPLQAGSTDAALLRVSASGPHTVQAANTGGGTVSLLEVVQIDNARTDFAPAIMAPLLSAAVADGSAYKLAAPAVGRPYPTFQWLKNGQPIFGATSATLAFASFQAADAGDYAVVLTNSVGTVTSAMAALSLVVAAPTLTVTPATSITSAGLSATFSSTVSGTAPFSYQWSFNGTPIAGATGTTLTIANAQAANAGPYSLTVTNAGGSVTKNVTLTVNPSVPVFLSNLAPQTVDQGDSVTFSVVVRGTEPFSYEWRKFGVPIAGAPDSPSYTIAQATPADAGNYRVFVTNSVGTRFSNLVALTVIPDTTPPMISELTASPDVLSPPNHQMVPVTLTAVVSDVVDPSPVTQIVSVTSNQSTNGRGDGNTAVDWTITGPLTLELRAERSGKGGDRVYTITVESRDASGNVSMRAVAVTVPKGS